VRVLLDENLQHDLGDRLEGYVVLTVQGLGWAGVQNGELLRRANGQVDVLLTMDRRLVVDHDLSSLSFGVIVIHARSNRVHDLLPMVVQLRLAIDRTQPGNVERVGPLVD
jgi:hypothetical protein